METEKLREKKKNEFEDDGRVIANMDVDGMPWGGRMAAGTENDVKDRKFRDLNISGGYKAVHGKNFGDEGSLDDKRYEDAISKEDRKWYIFGALKASLIIGLAFGVGFFLFILFCVLVWFK